jgi:hypothetical protein
VREVREPNLVDEEREAQIERFRRLIFGEKAILAE